LRFVCEAGRTNGLVELLRGRDQREWLCSGGVPLCGQWSALKKHGSARYTPRTPGGSSRWLFKSFVKCLGLGNRATKWFQIRAVNPTSSEASSYSTLSQSKSMASEIRRCEQGRVISWAVSDPVGLEVGFNHFREINGQSPGSARIARFGVRENQECFFSTSCYGYFLLLGFYSTSQFFANRTPLPGSNIVKKFPPGRVGKIYSEPFKPNVVAQTLATSSVQCVEQQPQKVPCRRCGFQVRKHHRKTAGESQIADAPKAPARKRRFRTLMSHHALPEQCRRNWPVRMNCEGAHL